jgi:hypothetical protein
MPAGHAPFLFVACLHQCSNGRRLGGLLPFQTMFFASGYEHCTALHRGFGLLGM